MKDLLSSDLEKNSLKQKIKTSIAFTKNFFVTGAFKETSRAVEVEICKHIPPEAKKTVVEFGMGHGNITRQILDRLAPNSKLYAFEVKEEFCEYVKEAIIDDRLQIINDGAENVKKYVTQPVDAIIVSIPFSFLSAEKVNDLIQDSYELLKKEAYYSQVLYAKFNVKKIKRVFKNSEYKSIGAFPTEYVYHFKK